jgi:hypothetical protein
MICTAGNDGNKCLPRICLRCGSLDTAESIERYVGFGFRIKKM